MHARTSLISHVKQFKASSAEAQSRAEADLWSAEGAFFRDPSLAAASRLRLLPRVVSQMEYEWAKSKLFSQKQRLFEHGERAGKLLAYLVHCEDRPPVVINLRSETGTLLTNPGEVTERFRSFFYSTLYF